MNKRKMVRLGDVCFETDNANPAQFDRVIRYIDISSVDSISKRITKVQEISSKDAPSRARQKVIKNDILVSTVRPNLNAVATVETENSDQLASTGFCVLRPNRELLYPRYLFGYLCSPMFVASMTKQATGASYPAVSNTIVKNERIPLPPIDEQKHISTTLDAVSELIRLRKRQLEEIDLLVKSRFVEMFGTIDTNSHSYLHSNLADVAKEFFAGGDKPSDCQSEQDETHQYPVYANGYENQGIQGYSSQMRVKDSAVTVSARGTIGYCFIRSPKFTPAVRLITIVPKENVTVEYLKYAIETMSIDSSGTSQAQLTVPDFKKKKIIVPPIVKQEEFASFLAQTDKSKFVIQQSITELETLKQALMQKYFGSQQAATA